MNATTHPVAPEEVMALLDGELLPERVQAVSMHVKECAECEQIAESLRATSRNIAAWTVGTLRRLNERDLLPDTETITPIQKLKSSFSALRDLLSRGWVWAPALSLVVALIAVAVILPTAFVQRKPVSQSKAVMLERVEPLDISPYQAKLPAGGGGGGTAENLEGRDILPAQHEFPSGGPQAGTGTRLGASPSEPMIARTVSLSIVVKDFDAGRASLDAILARHNGYAAGLNVSTPQGAARALQASLRIPARQLAATVSELKSLGRVEAETQNGEEVTQQHADLVARLKNSRETEQRLQDVLRTRTGKVKDVLEVEEEIARVRGEIEQIEAEQKTLEHRVDFATIDLKLTEEYKAQLSNPAPSVTFQLRNATVNGFRNAFESLLGIVLFLAESGPTLLLWLGILAVPAWMLWRRYRRAQSLGSLAERLS
jgi:uncharacterized protein DUF4349